MAYFPRSVHCSAMAYLHILIVLLSSLHLILGNHATTTRDTISAGQPLRIHDKLVSQNGRYALGFFEAGSSQNTSNWYLGIWFNSIPKFTVGWVANRDAPMKNHTSLELKISHDGNLVVANRATDSIVWSTEVNMNYRNNTIIAVLLNSSNLVLRDDDASNSSSISIWQSFDHPTDSLFQWAKLGWDNATGLNRRLVSKKNSISPASGLYREELDPSGVNQVVLASLIRSTKPYWASGAWNGNRFNSSPEVSRNVGFLSFVETTHEKYHTYHVSDEVDVYYNLGVSGQVKVFVWPQGSQDWVLAHAEPRSPCDVYAACGPYTVCDDGALPHCTCMKGFTVTSVEDWELDDRSSGCSRNTALDCNLSGESSVISMDKFLSVPCVSFGQSEHKTDGAKSSGECAQVCLRNCSCTAYSFSNDTCLVWHQELLNIRQIQCGATADSNGGTLNLRLAAKDIQSLEKSKRVLAIRAAIGTSAAAAVLCLFALIMLIMTWRNRRKSSYGMAQVAQGCNGIITSFRYIDLQRATKNFSEKLGQGGFGSVFKGFLSCSTAVAVKRLNHAHHGEKQFRAEVKSIGIIQHINLVRLVGFCCEGARRLLVYEHMPNGSLDIHLFRSHTTLLKWSTRYQIALGVARGLTYLHEGCRDCIIHCDIKPENILLSDSFAPKIADFGMAKILGRDASRALTTFRGTIGYLAPEWITGVAITPKVDVYAYGMVLLEIISGQRNASVSCSSSISDHDIYYPVHVARVIVEGDVMSLLDHRLNGDADSKQVEIACKVACWCIQDDESNRPTMAEVVKTLEGLLEINKPPMPTLLQAIAGS